MTSSGANALTLLLYVISPWALYFTGWYDASLRIASM